MPHDMINSNCRLDAVPELGPSVSSRLFVSPFRPKDSGAVVFLRAAGIVWRV